MSKVFLGGTCNGSEWRNELIPYLEELEVDYFNPVVEDWTEECIKEEEYQKNEVCDIHLYVITKEQNGPYSMCEALNDAWTIKDSLYHNETTTVAEHVIFYVDPDGFDKKTLNSIKQCGVLIENVLPDTDSVIVIEDKFDPKTLAEYLRRIIDDQAFDF